jgi:hypothetical protein
MSRETVWQVVILEYLCVLGFGHFIFGVTFSCSVCGSVVLCCYRTASLVVTERLYYQCFLTC